MFDGEREIVTYGNDDIEMLRASIAEVLASECDRRSVHRHVAGDDGLERRLWRQAGELGWIGIAAAEAFGGLGMGVSGMTVLFTELGRVLAPGSFGPSVVAGLLLSRMGSGKLQANVLPRIVSGEVSVAAPAEMDTSRCTLKIEADRLTGGSGLLLGGAQEAQLALVVVQEDAGPMVAVVEIDGMAARLSRSPTWDQIRGLWTLACEDAPCRTIGHGDAVHLLRQYLELYTAADSLGGMIEIVDQTAEYLKSRVQFGRPIGSFQALKHRMADLHARISYSRELLDQAVVAAMKPEAGVWPSIAKASISKAYASAAGESIQLHGGVGFTDEYDVHLFLKRARLNEMLVAANHHEWDVAGERLFEATRRGQLEAELEL